MAAPGEKLLMRRDLILLLILIAVFNANALEARPISDPHHSAPNLHKTNRTTLHGARRSTVHKPQQRVRALTDQSGKIIMYQWHSKYTDTHTLAVQTNAAAASYVLWFGAEQVFRKYWLGVMHYTNTMIRELLLMEQSKARQTCQTQCLVAN